MDGLFSQTVFMPVGATVLSVGVQESSAGDEQICLWALCEPGAPGERRFRLVFTGSRPPDEPYRFVGTVQTPAMGALVWHVFELLT